MRRKRNWIITIICTTLILCISIFYASFVSKRIHEESYRHLEELFIQVNKTFNSLVSKNWNLLNDWNPYISELLSYNSEDDVKEYLAECKNNWEFTDFYFFDANGGYISIEGKEGYIDLGNQLSPLMLNGENVVVDATISDGESVTIFAIKVAPGVYKDFSYDAIAVAYSKQSMEDILDVNVYDSNADCKVIYPDGRVLFSVSASDTHPYNYFSYLESEARFKDGSLEKIKEEVNKGNIGTVQYEIEGADYYLVYQSIGFQNWILLGITPVDVVNARISQVQLITIVVLVVIFVILVFMVLYYLIRRNRRNIRQKEAEIKKREQLFNMLVNNTKDIFIMLSAIDYKVEYVSPNLETLLGIPVDEIYKNIRRLNKCAVDFDEEVTNKRVKALSINDISVENRQRRHEKTGELYWYNETLYYISIEGEEKLLLVMTDQTTERESRRQLEQALDIAKSATQAKSSFLANMSHDIRTPMNTIVGLSSLISNEAENPAMVRKYTKKIISSSQHLLSIINDILDMSKIESGKLMLNEGEFKLSQLFEEINTVVKPQLKAKRQKFVIKVDNVYDNEFKGDTLRIKQILLNLLANAIKYTPEEGNIELSVRGIEQISNNYARLCFKVKDNGIGISEEYISSIYEPFSRENNEIVNGIQGTGLGMTITKNLVDLMGGTLSVESKQGKGSVFCVNLELRIVNQDIDKDFWKNNGINRMLVVSNDKDICNNVYEIMTPIKVEVLCTECIQSAVNILKKNVHYDLVLLDRKLLGNEPKKNIRELVESLKKPDQRLVLMAYEWLDIEKEAMLAGIDGVMAKPFFLSNFRQTVIQLNNKDDKANEAISELSISGIRVLAAEDNELNAEILAELLEIEGVQCTIARNGKEVVEKFESSKEGEYNLILMDVQMPIMNGYQATKAIREGKHPDAKTIQIIAMTANAFAEDVQAAINAGMNAHIAKPVNMEVLKHTIIKLGINGSSE